jgi:hypothetical protein
MDTITKTTVYTLFLPTPAVTITKTTVYTLFTLIPNTQIQSSQLGSISLLSNPAALGLNVSQLGTIAVVANGQLVQPLGPPIQLSCWTPCGVLLWNGV